MAGQFELLFFASFASLDTITVTHNLDRLQVGVLVRVGNVSRNDLIASITPLAADPRNAVVVLLDSVQSGDILIMGTDYVFANIPTPQGAVAASVAATNKTTTVDPTVSDDNTLGYLVGSRWLNTTTPSEFVCSDVSTGAAVWTLTTSGGGGGSDKIACCPFGAKSDSTGKLLIANGRSTDGDDSTKPKTRQPIGLAGTLTTLVYQTKEADSGTQMKVHVNGIVEATVVLANINANFGGVETISVSVNAGDYAEIEYDANQKPGECTMYFIQDLP